MQKPWCLEPVAALQRQCFFTRALHHGGQTECRVGLVGPTNDSRLVTNHTVGRNARRNVPGVTIRRTGSSRQLALVCNKTLCRGKGRRASGPVQCPGWLPIGWGTTLLQCKNLRQHRMVLLDRLQKQCVIGAGIWKHHVKYLLTGTGLCNGLH